MAGIGAGLAVQWLGWAGRLLQGFAIPAIVGLVVVAFLPEVPLRQTHSLAELDDDVESEQSPGGGALVVETTEGE